MNDKEFKLREWLMSDAASLAENANNIHIWNNVRDYFPHPYTEEDGKQFIQQVSDKPKPLTEMAIVIDEKTVGGIGVVLQTDVERICAEIGYWLGENYWNKGIITAVVKEMTEYVFFEFSRIEKNICTCFRFQYCFAKGFAKSGV